MINFSPLFNSKEEMPLTRALLWILVSVLLVSGSAFMGWLYFLHLKAVRLHDDQYRIALLIQRKRAREELSTDYLAYWLDLSTDRPVNLYQFDARAAEQRLLSCPFIKQAAVKKIRPQGLLIDYQLRIPQARLKDYVNAAVDVDGYLFPYAPLYVERKIPEFFLGSSDENVTWGMNIIHNTRLNIAFNVLKAVQQILSETIEFIDVSNSTHSQCAQRQIVVVIYDPSTDIKTFLRLNPDHYREGLMHYKQLKYYPSNSANHRSDICVVDLRLSHLAFIKSLVSCSLHHLKK